MDISMIIVSLVLVGSVFIPFYVFNATGQSERKKIGAKIKQVIVQHNLKVSESENWGNTYIGSDAEQRKVLFLKITPLESIEQLVDLNTLKTCQIVEKRKSVKTKEKKELLLEKLDLELLKKNGDRLLLNFYDASEDRMEDFELKRAEKWKGTLDHMVTTNSQGKKTALFTHKILSA